MNKILQIIPATIISACFAGNVAGAQALPDCDLLVINGTGPNSTNQVVCEVSTDVQVDCENNVYILNENSQNAASGDASSQGNVTSGTAISGNAVNSNGEVVEIGSSCDAAPVNPGRGSTSPNDGLGGIGATMLPNTSTSGISPVALASLAVTAAIASVTAVILAASRRL